MHSQGPELHGEPRRQAGAHSELLRALTNLAVAVCAQALHKVAVVSRGLCSSREGCSVVRASLGRSMRGACRQGTPSEGAAAPTPAKPKAPGRQGAAAGGRMSAAPEGPALATARAAHQGGWWGSALLAPAPTSVARDEGIDAQLIDAGRHVCVLRLRRPHDAVQGGATHGGQARVGRQHAVACCEGRWGGGRGVNLES